MPTHGLDEGTHRRLLDQARQELQQYSEVEIMQRAGLSIRQSEVWYKMRIDGWTEGEVSRHLHIEIGTVQSHLWRAEAKIQQTKELMQAEETQPVTTHIPADKDCQPGLPTDYVNTPLAAAMHSQTRSYIHVQRKKQEKAYQEAEAKRLKKLREQRDEAA